MARFYLPPDSWTGPPVIGEGGASSKSVGVPSTSSPALTGDEARHLSQVLRVKPGETITIFDGLGRRATAEVLQISRDTVKLDIREMVPPALLRPRITLVQAIPKGKNMDLIVQKAVELGVSAIQPLVTKNTVVQPGEGKSDKWRRTALEACKQCGQDTLPQIADPLSFEAWISRAGSGGGLKLIASLAPGARPMREILRAAGNPAGVSVIIGPEGDFTPAETAAALAAGYLPVTLGDIVLRVETATFFCLSALRYEFGV